MLIKSEELKKLLEIIPNYPKINIFHLNNNALNTSKILYEFCQKNNYEYDLFSNNEEYLEKLKNYKVQKFNIKAQRYNKHAKLYDFVFLNMDIQTIEDKKNFFKKIYMICKNGAKILIFLQQKDFDLENLLEELNFVAFNYIDISNNYEILSIQKMHGWGVYDLR